MSTESLQPVAIFWDIENCAVPHGVNVEEVSGHIRRTFKVDLEMQGPIRVFSAYGDFSLIPRHTRQGCQMTGVNLIDVPHGKKDAADKAILADMFLFALDNPAPGTILSISGDVDFAPALHKLGQRGYSVVLAIPSGLRVSSALCNACQHLLSWPDVARGKGVMAVETVLTSGKNDGRTWKMVVQEAKRECTDSFKSKHVAKDNGALGKHQRGHDAVAGLKNAVKGPSCTQDSSGIRRIPDGIYEEQVKVPTQFAKEFEAVAVAMGNVWTHGKVAPFNLRDMHENAHDQGFPDGGFVRVLVRKSADKQVKHHRNWNSSHPRKSSGPVTRSQKMAKKEMLKCVFQQSIKVKKQKKKKSKNKSIGDEDPHSFKTRIESCSK
ncbi:hypothetical protein GOP47_0002320 [Adiantum capillus-veneris]|uniref:NYN domain-containing protein n=1 Tax=Adiantum capillus-veneris TaxID=13818 RepID=A0A9D4VAH4_ADICA|nr:hypothetical protein GOP47_0002320 [Adiantum capillus-veneris]